MDLATGVLDFSCLTEGVLLDELSLCGLRLFSSFFRFFALLFCMMLSPPLLPFVLPFSCGDRDDKPLWFRLLFWPPLLLPLFMLPLLGPFSLCKSSTTSSLSDLSLSVSRSSSRSLFTFFTSCVCCSDGDLLGSLRRLGDTEPLLKKNKAFLIN